MGKAEEGASKLLVEKIHEGSELEAEIAKAKNEVYKLDKFIREMQIHFSGKSERDTNASN